MPGFVATITTVQHLAAAEHHGAAVLGARIDDVAVSHRPLVARLVRHADWRARQWDELAPTVEGLRVDGCGEWTDALDALATAPDPIAAWRSVLEAFAAGGAALATADPVGLAPVRRVATRIAADLSQDLVLLESDIDH